MTSEELKQQADRAQRRTMLEALTPIGFNDLMAVVNRWLLIIDPGVVKFLCAAYLANRLSTKAVWVFFIGPSGGGKTELLNCLTDQEDVFSISSLTPNTFLSGMPGSKNASLLPQLGGKIMIFKDWTTVLSMQKEARAEIMAQLREIWDGQMTKSFGTGKTVVWKGKVGLIAGSTQIVDLAQQQTTVLGERFIHYRILMPDRKEVARRALTNAHDQEQMGDELRAAFYAYLKGIDMAASVPADDPIYREELIRLTDFITRARSGVVRDFGMKKEVLFVPTPEMPTRLTQQLDTLSRAMMCMNDGPLTESDKLIIYKAALDSIPATNKLALIQLARQQHQTTAGIATALGYPTATIHIYLENMAMLGVVVRSRGADTAEGGTADRWSMCDDYIGIMQAYEGVPIEKLIDPPSPIVENLALEFGGEVIE